MTVPVLVSYVPVLSHTQEYWEDHGVHCGNRSPPDWRCQGCELTTGTQSLPPDASPSCRGE